MVKTEFDGTERAQRTSAWKKPAKKEVPAPLSKKSSCFERIERRIAIEMLADNNVIQKVNLDDFGRLGDAPS